MINRNSKEDIEKPSIKEKSRSLEQKDFNIISILLYINKQKQTSAQVKKSTKNSSKILIN